METGDTTNGLGLWVVHMLDLSRVLMRSGTHLIVPDYIGPPGKEESGADPSRQEGKIKRSNTMDLLKDASLSLPRIGIMKLKSLGTG